MHDLHTTGRHAGDHAHHDGSHPADHVHPHVGESHPPTSPSRAVMLDVGDHAGALILTSSVAREGLEVEIHPEGSPERRTHVWVLPREGRGQTVYAAVFPSLAPGTYAVLEPDGQVGRMVEVAANTVTRSEWLEHP